MTKSPSQPGGNGGGALVPLASFPILSGSAEQVQDVLGALAVNLGGSAIDLFDLTRIKIPSAGSTTWDIEGEEPCKTLDAIILDIQPRCMYWSDPNPCGNPPDCYSQDGRTGLGNPGGACAKCPMKAWGSAVKADGKPGRGKACRDVMALFLMRPKEDAMLPDVLFVTPGSLREFRKYQVALTKKGLPYIAVVTRLALEKVQNKDGIAYAQIKASMVGVVPKEQRAAILQYVKTLRDAFAQIKPEADDIGGNGDTVEV